VGMAVTAGYLLGISVIGGKIAEGAPAVLGGVMAFAI
jgi:hypothetical protein